MKGTKLEIAEALLWAIKSTASNHSHRLFDVFGKEGMLFSAFKDPSTSQIEEKAMLSLYENLLRECEERCSDEMAQQLLELRKGLDHCAISIHWKNADRRLAKILSFRSNLLQIAAFNIYIKLNDNQEAEQLILSLLNFDIQGGESELIAALPTFISRLPKEKCHVASTILLSPIFKNVFEHSTADNLKPILEWYVKMVAAKVTNLELALAIFHYAIEKASSSNTAQNLVPYAYGLMQCLKSTDSLLKKSNLKLLLAQNHDKLIQLLGAESKWDDIFELMTAFKRLSINLPIDKTSVAIYTKMFSILQYDKDRDLENLYTHYLGFQDFIEDKEDKNNGLVCFWLVNKLFTHNLDQQAYSLMPQLMSFLRNAPKTLLVDCNPMFIVTCQTIMEMAVASNEQALIIHSWDLFWGFYTRNLIYGTPDRLAEKWHSVFKAVSTNHPIAYYLILYDIRFYVNFLKLYTNDNIDEVIVSLFEEVVVLISKGKTLHDVNLAQGIWLNAKVDLKQLDLSLKTKKELELFKILVMIIAAKPEECKMACEELKRIVLELPEEINSILQMNDKFNILLKAPQSKNVDDIFEGEIFKIYFHKICQVFNNNECIEVDSIGKIIRLLDAVFFNRIPNEQLVHFLEISFTCKPFRMFGANHLLFRLRVCKELTDQQRDELTVWFGKYLKELENNKVIISEDLFLEFIKPPILDKMILGNGETAEVYQSLISVSYYYLIKTLCPSVYISNIRSFTQFCALYIPMITKISEKSYAEALVCVIELSKHDHNEKACEAFLNIIYDHLKKISPKTYDLEKNNVDYMCLELLFDSKPINLQQINCIKNMFKNRFLTILDSNEITQVDRFLTSLHKYAFLSFTKEAGLLAVCTSSTMDVHHRELKHILLKAWKKKILKNPMHLFQYNFLKASPNFALEKISPAVEEKAVKELIDTMLSADTYFGIMEATKILASESSVCYNFSQDAYIYCWEKIFQSASNCIDPSCPVMVIGVPIFSYVQKKYFTDKLKRSKFEENADWEIADIAICKTIFKGLCNPQNCVYSETVSSIDLCKRTTDFLIDAFRLNCFSKNYEIYYELVSKLMLITLKEMHKADDKLRKTLYMTILPLIKLENLPNEYSEKLANFWFSLPDRKQ